MSVYSLAEPTYFTMTFGLFMAGERTDLFNSLRVLANWLFFIQLNALERNPVTHSFVAPVHRKSHPALVAYPTIWSKRVPASASKPLFFNKAAASTGTLFKCASIPSTKLASGGNRTISAENAFYVGRATQAQINESQKRVTGALTLELRWGTLWLITFLEHVSAH